MKNKITGADVERIKGNVVQEVYERHKANPLLFNRALKHLDKYASSLTIKDGHTQGRYTWSQACANLEARKDKSASYAIAYEIFDGLVQALGKELHQ